MTRACLHNPAGSRCQSWAESDLKFLGCREAMIQRRIAGQPVGRGGFGLSGGVAPQSLRHQGYAPSSRPMIGTTCQPAKSTPRNPA